MMTDEQLISLKEGRIVFLIVFLDKTDKFEKCYSFIKIVTADNWTKHSYQ